MLSLENSSSDVKIYDQQCNATQARLNFLPTYPHPPSTPVDYLGIFRALQSRFGGIRGRENSYWEKQFFMQAVGYQSNSSCKTGGLQEIDL